MLKCKSLSVQFELKHVPQIWESFRQIPSMVIYVCLEANYADICSKSQ